MLDITTVLVLVAALVLFQAGRKRLNRLPLPPGPPRLPLVGNAREMPSDEPWIWYGTELLEKYGAYSEYLLKPRSRYEATSQHCTYQETLSTYRWSDNL